MDKASVIVNIAPRLFLLAVAAGLAACSLPEQLQVKKAQAPAQANPPPAVELEKPVNVSFSTYSPDWPVGWQWIDPEESTTPTQKDVKKGVLRVKIPTGKNLVPEKLTAPRYLKPVMGDFEIETRVKFAPKENYQGAGLLIFVDNARFLRFERAFGGHGGGGEGIRLDVRASGEYESLATPDDIPTELTEVDLKIVRTASTFSAFWRENEDASWREAGTFESEFPSTVFAGLIAANTARETTAEFAYIHLSPLTKPSPTPTGR